MKGSPSIIHPASIKWLALFSALSWAYHVAAQGQYTPSQEEQRLLEADPRSLLGTSSDARTYYATTRLADMEARDEREAPAQVQVITSRQLKAYGVRNLQEALMLVPGISMALGRDASIGAGIHGNWAMEGQCLFMLDGKVLNEADNGSFALGNRVPMANVERIEILTGPSFVMHGGMAALGVVNIVTRTAEHGTGSAVDMQTGFANGQHAYTTTTASGAHRLSGQQDLSFLISRSTGTRSNADYLLPDSTRMNAADSTGFASNSFQLAYRWKSLKASAAYVEERFHPGMGDHAVLQRNMVFGLEQRAALVKRLELYWRAGHSDQAPWNYINTGSPALLSANTSSTTTSAKAILIYKPVEGLALRAGVDGSLRTSIFEQRHDTLARHFDGSHAIPFPSMAWLAEASWRSKAGVLLAGFRQEQHSLAGTFGAPRFAFTRVARRFHGKIGWGRSYRIPSLFTLDHASVPGSLLGAQVTSLEGELGLRIGKAVRITGNIYQTTITDPIMATIDSTGRMVYRNGTPTGTEGIDARLQIETKRMSLLVAAGLVRRMDGITGSATDAPGDAASLQGLPPVRLIGAIGYEAAPWLTLRCRGSWQSGIQILRYTSEGHVVQETTAEQALLYAGIGIHPDKERRLSVDLSCGNILDTPQLIVSPAHIDQTPLQLNGRQWQIGVTYNFVR
ncbi:MAG: TonB-dependent receptor [Flavobacteriales bacterium]|nr:TonB-dependent receptor [Flavobacteriales bacterium]